MTSSAACESLLTSFLTLREQAPERVLFTYVDARGRDQERLTAAELGARAEAVARALHDWRVHPGDRAVLVYPPGTDFIVAFLGCLAAGVVPVPVCPPDPSRAKDVRAFGQIARDSGAKAVLTNGSYERVRAAARVTSLFVRDSGDWPDLTWRRTDRVQTMTGDPIAWQLPVHPDEPAFLQYTSGSTSAPRGVIIGHGNLHAETQANAADLVLGPDAIGVSWVPHYHDLGLISVICSTIAGNCSTYLLSPLSFLRHPALWFETAARVRATHTAAPNFAYDLVVRKTTAEQRAAWDLSPLHAVMSAGEPVRPATVSRFLDAFACTGLSPAAFYPAYGLAECTVSVTMGGRGRIHADRAALEHRTVIVRDEPGPGTVELMGCGRIAKADACVRIVDPESRKPCLPGQVGEIWVDSPTKALGYLGHAELSEQQFRARLAGEDDPRAYLRTGDLGFFHERELYVTGRHKDLMIVRGRNVYPQDIEETAQHAHPCVRPGGVAAFSTTSPEDGERMVLFVELRERKPSQAEQREVILAVRAAIRRDHELGCDTVVLGGPGTVLKTTSGKVRRGACRELYESGLLHTAAPALAVSGLPGPARPPVPVQSRADDDLRTVHPSGRESER
ncbi:fatty acyl-AMP ligase [Streptomyces sp. MNP-20]|uniref:fatty acyl-AMP ligase n=1 Tax=Streptomyces sp. MNP-20 TaxID=2721165 RepID=UPI001557C478|nr:fatty acyl-AMP ligase [Streptomyces sp. MNP-20]